MKKILLFIFIFISFISYAQLDREHWFAPMVDRTGRDNQVQRIYMSTNETTPFKVDVYNNNVIIGSVTISKNNPNFYQFAQRNHIIATSTTDLFKPVSKGIYLKGDKPFFASLRFSVSQHGEILTSKGTAGIGTEFRTVMAPITANNGILNFMTSVMATENNTTVTISNFSPTLQFSDNINRTQFNFVLNKGQSYIIDGSGSFSQNWTGFIGAKIVSDKPISITNGNFNGQYATTATNSSDILMDQGVPVDKLGQEFVLMKGNGTTSSGMEKAIVVATENNTEIYINNGATPVATINAGQHYLTNNSAYLLQGSDHYNMRIQTNKNVYVYQLLAGDDGTSMVATGGFNYIPPLNCYLPKKIDEIGFIDQNRVYIVNIGGFRDQIPTKLNIITERGATVDVKRNGTSLALNTSNGPFNVSGNLNWVTYSVPNISGNVAIFSSKAVTAGISAGDDAVGYGGYFAGFSSIPLITKTVGDCLPGVKLEVTEGFDSYLWLIKTGATYAPAPGVNNLFQYEPTQAGIYAVQVKQGSCPQIQTQDFKFYNCTTYTNVDYNSCGSETITPAFALSSQAVNPTTVQIVTPPTKGTVTIAANGDITYLANPGISGTDTFKYSFCGFGVIPDCETVQATVKMIEKRDDVVLQECSTNGIATYNLTLANVTPDATITKSYFKTPIGAQNNIAADEILNFTNYTSADTFVYARLVNSFSCVAVAKIELKHKLAPEVKENLYTKTHCDEDIDGKIDGIYKVNLATITPIVLVQASNFIVKYYSDFTLNTNITGTFSFNSDTSIWIKVDAPNGCTSVVKEILLKTGTKFTVNDPVTVFECDDNLNNSETTTLSKYTSLFTTDPSATVLFFNSLADAQSNTPTTSDAQTITTPRTFYYRFKRPGFCEVIGTLNISLKPSTPTALLDSYTVCAGSSITLNAESTYTSWLWKKGTTTVSTTQTASLTAGIYTISFTDASGCTFTKNITVVDSPKPQLNIAAYNATLCDSNFDGNSDPVNFNTITPIIVTNFAANPGLFNVRYYLDQNDRDLGNANTIPNLTNWTFSTNTTVYVRIESPYCPFEKADILFKFGTSIPLISNVETVIQCDTDANGTKVINLALYRNLFTTDASATVRYFDTLPNAQANTPTTPTTQPMTGDKTFYYRFKKTGFCDVIGTLNVSFKAATPTALLDSYTVCAGSSITLNAESTYTSWLWKKGTTTVSTTQTASLTAGVYTVAFTNASGCTFTKNITVVDSPKPVLNFAAYNATLCDDNFDGIINVNLLNVTPIIVTNFAANPGLFNVRYYTSQAFADAGGNNNLPNNWSFTTDIDVYVRIESQYCSYITGVINFKFGTSIPLIAAVENVIKCDNDLNGTENINLSSYRNLFTTDASTTVRYFDTLPNAQANTPTISTTQPMTGDKTFYYRFKKTGFCDVIGTLNVSFKAATPTTLLDSYTVCAGSSITLNAESTYSSWLWKKGTTTVSTTQTASLTAGVYTVAFTNASGCTFTKNITVVDSPKPLLNIAAYNATFCDSNFDGNSDPVNFNTITPIIVPNFAANSTLFTVRYYLVERDRDLGNGNTIPNLTNWTFSTNTTVYMRVESPYCTFIKGDILFKFGNNLPILTSTIITKECDDDFDGKKTVDLSKYISQFTTETGVTPHYFNNLPDAQNNTNEISSAVEIDQTGTYYLRLHKNNYCDVVVKITINIQIPVTSTVLEDKNICPDTTTSLDAGPGFNGYLWSTGETTQKITVPVGDYWVELTTNGCTYKQFVSVKAVSLPQIISVEIKGSTVTVTATGGTSPLQYAMDNFNYQTSNVFTNVRGGDHTIYVISADNCAPVSTEINVIELYNVITPNGDGINDVLNYSALMKKEEPFMQIFDRYGKIIFTGDKNNQYSWDGRSFGKIVNTGSYWYVMKWKEPGFNTVTEYNGWILVKNRE